jgi:hypothetical protein
MAAAALRAQTHKRARQRASNTSSIMLCSLLRYAMQHADLRLLLRKGCSHPGFGRERTLPGILARITMTWHLSPKAREWDKQVITLHTFADVS